MLGKLTIATRSDPQQPGEGAPHYIDPAESSCRGHVLEAYVRSFELTARRLHTYLEHVLLWCRANLSRESRQSSSTPWLTPIMASFDG